MVNVGRLMAAIAILGLGLLPALLATSLVQSSTLDRQNALTDSVTSTPAPYVPTLYISFREGAPQSIITFSGLTFPAEEPVTLSVNDRVISTLNPALGSTNWFVFHLNFANANEGRYLIIAETQSVSSCEWFRLDSSQPIRQPLTGGWYDGAPVFGVPPDIAFTSQVFLPVIKQQP